MLALSTFNVQTDDLPDEDAGLVSAAQKDPAAFRAIYERWGVPVYQYFYYRTADVAHAEDLTSQLFLTIYQSIQRYHHRGHFAAWLFTIARNLIWKEHRKLQRETSLDGAQQLTSSSDPSAEYAESDEIIRLQRLLRTLPADEQELIRLRYAAGLNFADIAAILHRNEDAVKKSLYRLQARLQNLLEANDD
jgi:RNA polymerase sigma-70 factor (ECF subfamily)